MKASCLVLMILTAVMIRVIICCLSFKCGLPSVEECTALGKEAMSEGDLFSAVKFHLLSSEPENALRIGIDFIKGTDSTLCVCMLHLQHLHMKLICVIESNVTIVITFEP